MKRILTFLLPVSFILALSGLVFYGSWLNHLARGESAFDQGRYEDARSHFQRAFSGWELTVLPTLLVGEDRSRAGLNRVQLDYRMGAFDDALEFLRSEAQLSSLAAYHHWMGNVLVSRALQNLDRDLLDSLTRSREAYLEALRQDPGLWDATHNYEYVSAILAELESGGAHAEEDVKLLLEKMRTDIQRDRRMLPPEERK